MDPEEDHSLEEPLVHEGKLDNLDLYQIAEARNKQHKTRTFRQRVVFLVATILPWCLVLLGTWNWIQRQGHVASNANSSQLVYSPVQHLLEYELRKFGTGEEGDPSPYWGEPSPELDEAWEKLYPSLFQLIDKEQAAQLPSKTVIFPHDPERRYMVELDVFHQLHCLNMIRKHTRPDYYKNSAPGLFNGKEEDALLGPQHIAHCMEPIRQAIMCFVDVTPYTYIWDKESESIRNVLRTPHTCRNFDKIRDWASLRAHQMFVPTRSHPSAPDRPPFETAMGLLAAPMDKLMDMLRSFPQK